MHGRTACFLDLIGLLNIPMVKVGVRVSSRVWVRGAVAAGTGPCGLEKCRSRGVLDVDAVQEPYGTKTEGTSPGKKNGSSYGTQYSQRRCRLIPSQLERLSVRHRCSTTPMHTLGYYRVVLPKYSRLLPTVSNSIDE